MVETRPMVFVGVETRHPEAFELHDTRSGRIWVIREGRWVAKRDEDVWMDQRHG